MKKVILVYSKIHFDPNTLARHSGAGFLAHSIYWILNSKFANSVVEYYDHTEHDSIINSEESTDLVVGISNNIHVFNKNLRPRKSVLFAVNYSAMSRRKIKSKAKDFVFNRRLLNWEDGIYSNLEELDGVTAVVTLGDFSNYLSYVRSGVLPSRVFPISSSLGHTYEVKGGSRKEFGNDILYFPGGISFRKGVAYLRPIVAWMESEKAGRILRIVGRAADHNLNEYIRDIVTEFPDSIFWERSWIEQDSNIWKENISKSRFAIFPSFEEGLPASVLDLIESDIPVLYSSACGLDFVSRDVVPKSMKVNDWVDLLRCTVLKSDDFLSDLLAKQKLMLENFPKDLVQLERIIERIGSETIWPCVEISMSLKMQIPGDSWLLRSIGISEYRIYDSISMHPSYPMNQIISTKEMPIEYLISVAIVQIDRYLKLKGLTIQHFDRFIIIERTALNFASKDFPIYQASPKFELFTIVDMHKKFKWPKIQKIFIIFKNRIFQSIRYRSQRILKNY